ncbi:hypothetical protein TRVL_04162 [Trypanosoma vivax]|nr:hypothetical protein TRVL_04162 [Trypanosoma vivax]
MQSALGEVGRLATVFVWRWWQASTVITVWRERVPREQCCIEVVSVSAGARGRHKQKKDGRQQRVTRAMEQQKAKGRSMRDGMRSGERCVALAVFDRWETTVNGQGSPKTGQSRGGRGVSTSKM